MRLCSTHGTRENVESQECPLCKLSRRNELLAEGIRRVELLVMALNGASLKNTITPEASEAWIRDAREALSDERHRKAASQ